MPCHQPSLRKRLNKYNKLWWDIKGSEHADLIWWVMYGVFLCFQHDSAFAALMHAPCTVRLQTVLNRLNNLMLFSKLQDKELQRDKIISVILLFPSDKTFCFYQSVFLWGFLVVSQSLFVMQEKQREQTCWNLNTNHTNSSTTVRHSDRLFVTQTGL